MPSDTTGTRTYLCLGSNVGDRAEALAAALDRLADHGLTIKARSALYETPPWGPVPQGPYLNQVVEAASPLGPRALLALALQVEHELGRDRSRETRFGPRRIDIDILWMEGHAIAEAELEIPHPRLLERAFVLVPLSEIAPELEISGVRVADALKRVDVSDIRRLGT